LVISVPGEQELRKRQETKLTRGSSRRVFMGILSVLGVCQRLWSQS
jgi:hypothetical protein